MGEFASNGKANAGLTTGIIGTTLGGLWALGAGNGGGILNGILGGNNCGSQVSALLSENAMLKAEKSTDVKVAEVYAAMRNEVQALQDRVFDKYISPISQEIADIRVREARMEGRINEVSLLANNGLTALQGQVNCLAQTVSGITKTVVPISAVCPTPMPQYNSWTAPTTDTTS